MCSVGGLQERGWEPLYYPSVIDYYRLQGNHIITIRVKETLHFFGNRLILHLPKS